MRKKRDIVVVDKERTPALIGDPETKTFKEFNREFKELTGMDWGFFTSHASTGGSDGEIAEWTYKGVTAGTSAYDGIIKVYMTK